MAINVKKESDMQLYKRIKRPDSVMLVSIHKKLRYGFLNDAGEEVMLTFDNGVKILDKDEDAEIIEQLNKHLEKYFKKHKVPFREDDYRVGMSPDEYTKVLLSGQANVLPFTLIDTYEATVSNAPQRIRLATGDVVEIAPSEIAELISQKERKKVGTLSSDEKELETKGV